MISTKSIINKMNKAQLVKMALPLIANFLATNTDEQLEEMVVKVLGELDTQQAERVHNVLNRVIRKSKTNKKAS